MKRAHSERFDSDATTERRKIKEAMPTWKRSDNQMYISKDCTVRCGKSRWAVSPLARSTVLSRVTADMEETVAEVIRANNSTMV